MPVLENIKSLIGRKNELCAEILKLTEGAVFNGNPEAAEDDAESFAVLYEQRGKLVTELLAVHEEIGGEGYAVAKDAGISDKSTDCLKRVLELDKRNMELCAVVREIVLEQIKRINQGRNLSLKYADSNKTGGLLVDSKG